MPTTNTSVPRRLWRLPLRGVADSVRALIAAGADIHYVRGHGNSILGYALESGNPECIKALIDAGEYSSGLLVYSASERKVGHVRALLAGGANVNARWPDDSTAFMKAARNGDAECVKVQLDAGADVNARDAAGHTALRYASFGRVRKMLKRAGGTL